LEDIKSVIAENISRLRRENNMTQIELADRLNYSDKAISKWERGESVPDISVLKAIADLFGVSVDYLISSEHEKITESADEDAEMAKNKKRSENSNEQNKQEQQNKQENQSKK
jgi:transcriptional regulator with XRE-family HTH domain